MAATMPAGGSTLASDSLDERTVDEVAGFVDCDGYEECRDYLQRHPHLIKQNVCDSLFEKGYLVFGTHPRAISHRFIRNAQVIHYLLDIQKATSGQQDITLFFHRLLGADPSFKAYFEEQVKNLMDHVEKSYLRRKAEKAAKGGSS
ncbi:hypothetical protein Pelo_6728 [Pelomyxa schiedti]|nr:hypothetical protein Pelo_6728 [Pelomyxa schiedti]